MENDSDLVCNAVYELFANQTKMTIIFGTQAISSLPAMLIGVFLAISICKTTSLHFNVRVLLANLSISTTVTNCGILIIAIHQLIALFSSKSATELCAMMAISASQCHNLRLVYSVGSLPPVVGLLFLAIERLIATLQFKTYEQNGKKVIGVGLVAIQWLLVSMMQLQHVDSNKVMPYCQEILSSPRATEYFIAFMLTSQLLGLVAFILLVRNNKRKMKRYYLNQALQLLSTRYQLEENVKTTKLMIPISAANCGIFAFSLIVISVIAGNLPESPLLTAPAAHLVVAMAPWVELTVLSMPMFVVTFCYVTITNSPTIRATMFRLVGLGDCGKARRAEVAAAVETADARNIYFRQLRNQWGNTEARAEWSVHNV